MAAEPALARVREHFADGRTADVARAWVSEVPVALEFNGVSYAVMMATPADLEDFAHGFARAEGLGAVSDCAVAEVDNGWIVRATVPALAMERLAERVRARVAESSCGLCGIENLEAVAKPLSPVAPHDPVSPAAIFAALAGLRDCQPLARATGGAHAAALCDLSGAIRLVREDVGRHNAMDKLAGAALRAGVALAPGFVLSTARCSYEIVEKAVRCGAENLVTVSLPTSMAVERARTAGLTLWALAREDSVLCVNEGSAR